MINKINKTLILKQYLMYNKIILSAIPKLVIKRNQKFRVSLFQSNIKRGPGKKPFPISQLVIFYIYL